MKTIFKLVVLLSIVSTSFPVLSSDHSLDAEFSAAYDKAFEIIYDDPQQSMDTIMHFQDKVQYMSLASKLKYHSILAGCYLMMDKFQLMRKSVDKGLSLIPKDYKDKNVVDLLNYRGLLEDYEGLTSVVETYQEALSIATQINFTTGIIDSNLNLAQYYIGKLQYLLAHEYAIKAYNISLEENNTEYKVHAAYVMGAIYTQLDRDEEALKYRTYAYESYLELGHTISATIMKVYVADSLQALKRYHLAEQNLLEVVSQENVLPSALYDANMLLAIIYESTRQYDKAQKYIEIAKIYLENVTSRDDVARWYAYKLSILLGMNEIKEAEKLLAFIDKGTLFSDDATSVNTQLHLLELRSAFHEKKGEYAIALKIYKEYKDKWTKQTDSKTSSVLGELRVKFESDKIERENRELTHNHEIATLKLAQTEKEKLYQTWFIIFVLCLGLFIAPVVWYQMKLKRKLSRMVNIDSLTKVFNRHYLMKKGRRLYEPSKRRAVNSVIMLDIDNFKNINDQFGHAIGDDVLKVVADITKNIVRETDKFGRMGGEEFVAILPNTIASEAAKIAERIRKAIADHNWDALNMACGITASVGVAALSNQDTGGFQRVLSLSDKAMYKAKTSGKDRVVTL